MLIFINSRMVSPDNIAVIYQNRKTFNRYLFYYWCVLVLTIGFKFNSEQ